MASGSRVFKLSLQTMGGRIVSRIVETIKIKILNHLNFNRSPDLAF